MLAEIKLRARAIKYRRKIDPAEVAHLLRTVRRGQSAIDLGAHKGAYTFWLAKAVGRAGRVVAVEPQRNLADRLAAVMASRAHVSVRWAAISDETGDGTLSLRPDGSSHGASIAGFADGNVGDTVTVPTITLPDLVREEGLETVDFIKCDIEGHEVRALAAAGEVLDRFRPVILCECEERHASGDAGEDGDAGDAGAVTSLRRVVEPHGYRMRFFHGGALRPIDEFDAAVHQDYGHGEYSNNFVLEPR